MKYVVLVPMFLMLAAVFDLPVTYASGMQDDVDHAAIIVWGHNSFGFGHTYLTNPSEHR